MPKLMTLQDLLVDQMRDLLSAEKQIAKALPRMARKCESDELRAALEKHVEQTERQLDRLEQACEQLGIGTRGRKCEAIEGLIEETKSLMEEEAEPSVLDAGLIACAQKVEHYEIASYGCAVTWASQLGKQQVARLLQQTLDEEKETDALLTKLAESSINRQAEQPVGAGSR